MRDPQPDHPLPVTFDDVTAAAARLDGNANRTPVMTSRTLDAHVSGSAFLKCENFQRAGAFKFRGAFNALSMLNEDQRRTGVLTYSSGNHAQATALAGRLLGVPVTVIMPDDAPRVKLEATKGYGATVVTYSREETTREELAAAMSTERRLPVIPPYDHPHVVAGQGTAGLELLEDVENLDLLLVCCGGGGLLSGCAIAARQLRPEIRIIGVEPAAADDATRSFYSGKLETVKDPDTIADGARTPSLGKITFPLVQHYVDGMVTVTDAELIDAMRFLWARMKLVVEPTGALALAAALTETVDLRDARTGILISGGNVDLTYALKLFATA
ncbi:MAG: threo-3-hydroxy-L-aspartate ammonia-lyase [Rhodothermales bacterium]|nr:threo-3-hydroxy-L-aspartate ammonia-lyase [Rhodothermales bacterium]